jgi:hypothetical protein
VNAPLLEEGGYFDSVGRSNLQPGQIQMCFLQSLAFFQSLVNLPGAVLT